MKKLFCLVGIALLLCIPFTPSMARTDCYGYLPFYPNHYCECASPIRLSSLDIDMQLTDTIWFKTNSTLFFDGFTAYLYSDCDVQIDIYVSCYVGYTLYSVTVPKNQARDITADAIKQKIAEAGFTEMEIPIYLCIHPLGGAGGRFLCTPYNSGPHSTCADPLPLLRSMTFVTSHTNDVYKIANASMPEDSTISVKWTEEANMPCHLTITRGACDGSVVTEYDYLESDTHYFIDFSLLSEVREAGEDLYLHFSHDTLAIGRIRMSSVALKYETITTDTTICMGKGLQLADTLLTESTTYCDTVAASGRKMNIYAYNLTIAAPEVEYDTVVVSIADLTDGYYYAPADEYVYQSGSYEYEIVVPNECTRRILLTVEEEIPSAIPSCSTTDAAPRLVLRNGVVYIQRGTQQYTLLGEPI